MVNAHFRSADVLCHLLSELSLVGQELNWLQAAAAAQTCVVWSTLSVCRCAMDRDTCHHFFLPHDALQSVDMQSLTARLSVLFVCLWCCRSTVIIIFVFLKIIIQLLAYYFRNRLAKKRRSATKGSPRNSRWNSGGLDNPRHREFPFDSTAFLLLARCCRWVSCLSVVYHYPVLCQNG